MIPAERCSSLQTIRDFHVYAAVQQLPMDLLRIALKLLQLVQVFQLWPSCIHQSVSVVNRVGAVVRIRRRTVPCFEGRFNLGLHAGALTDHVAPTLVGSHAQRNIFNSFLGCYLSKTAYDLRYCSRSNIPICSTF